MGNEQRDKKKGENCIKNGEKGLKTESFWVKNSKNLLIFPTTLLAGKRNESQRLGDGGRSRSTIYTPTFMLF